MKDFSDVWTLAQHFDFDGRALAEAIAATFLRRKTQLPIEAPLSSTTAFADDRQKQAPWNAFQRKARLPPMPLADVIATLEDFLLPVLTQARSSPTGKIRWAKGGSWLAS